MIGIYGKMNRILIYGTGNLAKNYIESVQNKENQIIGILDKYKFMGDFCNHPILHWDDIECDIADRIIICAQKKYEKTIYDRILFDCYRNGLDIYSWDGRNLSEEYRFYGTDLKIADALSCNQHDLYEAIDKHTAISFDLFDTLIMRKVLEPVDIFDVVEKYAQSKAIDIKNFKYKRRTAELLSNDGSIDKIYDILKEYANLSVEEAKALKEYELLCEKNLLIPRSAMLAAMNYAKSHGKKVFIISDMYMSKSYVQEVLAELEIYGYDNILISNEYGTSKSGKLFELYKQMVPEETYLHIGDNYNADVLSARKYGIDAFQVLSAYEMLKISSIKECLVWAHGVNNRRYIGELISALFNNPFSLHAKTGMVDINNSRDLAQMFFVPTVVKYCKLLKDIADGDEFAGILFGARDGYLLKKVYEKLYLDDISHFYFMTSRKAACKVALKDSSDVKLMKEYFAMSYGDAVYTSLWDVDNDEDALTRSEKDFECFKKYCFGEGISLADKYLLCELISGGTVHNRLNRAFDKDIAALYVHKKPINIWGELKCWELYSDNVWKEDHKFTRFMEKTITAPHPSVEGYEDDGTVSFANERRSKSELDFLDKIQNEILELADDSSCISDDLAVVLLNMMDRVNFSGELEFINHLLIEDDLNNSMINVL